MLGGMPKPRPSCSVRDGHRDSAGCWGRAAKVPHRSCLSLGKRPICYSVPSYSKSTVQTGEVSATPEGLSAWHRPSLFASARNT